MKPPSFVAGVVLAGGRSRRLAGFGFPVVADRIEGHAGPLAGLHAALLWAKDRGPNISCVVTVACDTPFLPDDLVERFLAALDETGRECCVARSAEGVHPVIGLWPIAIAGTLEAAL
ncbi:MAG: NTP transferase domain-containing protein, partial [Methyloceanibacter sp.]